MENESDVEKADEAVSKIQEHWRKSRSEQEIMAMKAYEISQWEGLTGITQQNNDLMERLKQLQISKSYDAEKFQRLLSLPAREVNSFMEDEAKKGDDEKMTEFDKIEQKLNEEKKDQAARTLQRYFRKIQVQQKRIEHRNRISKIKPKRRLELLEQINNRLNEKRCVRRMKGDDVIRALENHRSKCLSLTSAARARIEIDVRRHSLNLSRPNSPTRFAARSISQFNKYKAKKLHDRRMKEIENETMMHILEKGPTK